MFKKLTLLIALAIGLCWSGTSAVQAQDVPDEYIYFDLAAGNVQFIPAYGTYGGYVYVNGTPTYISGTHNATNRYYIYQSSTITDSPGHSSRTGYASQADFDARQNIRIPDYDPITGPEGQDWGEYSTNNTDVVAVRNQWVSAAENAKRTSTQNYIQFLTKNYYVPKYDIILDNVWSECYDHTYGRTAAMTFELNTYGEFDIKLKNYSKLNHIKYDRTASWGGGLHFTSIDGDGAKTGSLVVTYTTDDGFDPSGNNSAALIGGIYNLYAEFTPCYDLNFDGGTVYVGLPNYVSRSIHMAPTAIGGGANNFGDVTISGGVLTAVASTTGATIGGGGGTTGLGSKSNVSISGGEVYAYNFGLYNTTFKTYGSSGKLSVAGTAIGGGSTEGSLTTGVGGDATVTISGGYVYAQSVGGNAIGGGNSSYRKGGKGTVTITGGTVVAKSVSGNIGIGTESEAWSASTAIGGGTGGILNGVSGGDAVINISGSPTITAGSIGGGKTNNAGGKVGAAMADIKGNPDISAQFILASGASTTPYFKMSGGTIHDSKTYDTEFEKIEKTRGGAVYLEDGNCTISGGQIYGCEATEYGGAIFVKGGSVALSGGEIGVSGELPNKAAQGGGVYVEGTGSVTISGTGSLSYNKATNQGGGAYMNGGSISMSAGAINGNTAASDGGGFFVPGGTVTITGGDIKNNIATVGNGGGFYSAGGTVNISNAEISGNHADNGFGGGLYSAAAITVGTTASETGATISGNEAKNGGGFYVAGADDATTMIQGGSIVSNNRATANGAGAFIESGNLTVKTSDINGNTADSNGGGFYIQGGSSFIQGGKVQYNTATNGAGLYMKGTSASAGNKATATFSDGTFTQNTAYSAGGGIYIDDYAELTMKGNSQITNNTATSAGGGVYKRGETKSLVLVSGSGSSESAELKIYNNTVNGKANNLYLDQYDDYLTIDADGGLPEKMQLGVSVNTAGPKPLPTRVIRCTDFDILNGVFTKLMEAYEQTHQAKDEDYSFIYDDAERFLPVFASAPEPFTFEYIFFAEVWPSPYPEIPEDFNPGNISTPDELTYFMMKVNGIRCEKNATITGNVVADIDMSGRFWIPIGGYQASALDDKVPYSGVFHGNGHTISGLECIGLTGTTIYGLFGDTQGATIENVNLTDCNMTSGQADYFGLLVGKMTGGQVLNCNVSGTLDASGSGDGNSHSGQNDGGFIGGLVGGTFGDDVHIKNVISTVDIVAEFHKDSDGNYDNNRYIEDSRTVGGLVGITSAGTVIENGFANPKIKHGSWFPRYVGGLVGYNEGTLTNCYVRLERGVTLNIVPEYTDFYYNEQHYVYPSGTKSKFGMFAGYNGGTIDYCYAPNTTLFNTDHTYVHTSASGDNRLTNYGDYDAVVRPYTYTSYLRDNRVTMKNGTSKGDYLIDALNAWVEDANDVRTADAGYSRWMRTKASDVNDDYPVLSFDNLISTLNYTTIGSKKGYDLDYDNRFNEVYGRIEEAGEGCLFIYRTPWTGTIASPADEVIGNGVTVNNSGTDIKVFVEDGVALLQDAGSTLVNTYTCHEFNDASRSWHHISSSLNNYSPIGFNYENNGQVAYSDASNPCGASVNSAEYASFLPAGIPMADLDLYCFYEKEYHWINFKRNSSSHWHMNDQHQNIAYTNESNLVAGKGYLASFAGRTFVQAGGELTNGDVEIVVTAKAGSLNASASPAIPADEGTELKGYNLLGNPYQSCLDIAAFMDENSSLLVNTGKSGIDVPSYAIYDSEANAYVQGMASKPSLGSRAASDQIKMHEGFFIYTANDGDATFTNDMRRTEYTSTGTKRAEQPAYPLVNLMVADANGESDIAVAEFGRPQAEAAAKMMNIGANGKVYFHYADNDYALLYLNEDIDQLPVRFDAIENGTYTMTWSTANATFSYLHLIDNMTGIDVDMLTSDAYTFTASSSDYKSRFKLMFAYTGVEENEAASTSSASFAFMHDGALTVNGEGWLEVIDMSGRTIVSSRLTDAQNTVSLPQAAQGVYVLRLTNDNQSKVQKIVIE